MVGRTGVKDELGVLFVHGIGGQRQGDTLIRFGEPLYRWLEGWLGRGEPPRHEDFDLEIAESRLKPGSAEPASLRVSVPWPDADSTPRKWLLAESWWGTAFEAPGAADVAFWAAGFGPRVISRRGGRMVKAVDDSYQAGWEELEEVNSFVGLLINMTVIPWVVHLGWLSARAVIGLWMMFLTIVLWLLLLVAVLPLSLVPPLRPLLIRLQLTLSNVIGDTYVLERSPFAFAAMTSAVQRDLDWLEERAESLVVVAHSQGSVIADRALRDRPRNSVVRFVTLGSALRLLAESRAGAAEPGEDLGPEALRRPNGSAVRWDDYYGTDDPISEGPLWLEEAPEEAASTAVHNYNSMFRDHTGYWHNLDQFVSGLAVDLGECCGGEGQPAPDRGTVRRFSRYRERRTVLLSASVMTTAVVAAVAAALLGAGGRLDDAGRVLGATVGWLAGIVGAEAVGEFGQVVAIFAGIVLVGIAAAAVELLAQLAWGWWEGRVLARMYRRQAAPGSLLEPGLLIAPACAAALAVGALAVVTWQTVGVAIVAAVAVAVAFAILATLAVATRSPLRPPLPPKPQPLDHDALAAGREYAYQEGMQVRRARLLDLAPGNFEIGVGSTPKVKVRLLDDPPEGSRGAARDKEVLVRSRRLFLGWDAYEQWQGECGRLTVEWDAEETVAVQAAKPAAAPAG